MAEFHFRRRHSCHFTKHLKLHVCTLKHFLCKDASVILGEDEAERNYRENITPNHPTVYHMGGTNRI